MKKIEDLQENLNNEIKVLRRKIIWHILAILLFIGGLVLCVHWFSWKLFIVISLLMFSNNLSNSKKIKP